MSQQQTIKIPELFQDFFACRIVSDANHQYPEKTQRLIGLQNCLSRKSPISRKYSKTFLPAEMSQPQIINIPEISKDFFACRVVLAANHQYPGNIQIFFRLQNCLGHKSSISRKNSKTYWPAELSQPQVISIPEKFKDFFARRIVPSANHQYPGNIQRLFCLQKCLSRKSSISRKYPKTSSPAELSQQQIINTPEKFKDFFACRIVLAANHQYPGNIQRLLRLQSCLSSKSSKPRKYSKTFLPAEISQTQIINIPEISKDFFACRFVLAANHQYPGNIQRFFRLQNCLGRKSSISRKNSKTYWPAELSQPQVISIPERFKDFFARRIVPSANHQYPEKTQRLIGLQSCLSRKSSISENYSKTFFACRIVVAANHQYPGIIQRLFRLQNSTRSKSSKSRN